jgi:hypothetical protein
MGSLTSKPKAKAPAVVYMPASAPTPQPVTTPAATPAPTATPTTTPEQKTDKAREDNLLTRARGSFGTVLTGFRGLLTSAQAPARKTLLGE